MARPSLPALLTGVAAIVLAVVVVVALLARGDDDPYAAYCGTVEDHQQLIGAAIGEGADATGFLRALPALEDVAAEAPRDIRDEWTLLIDRINDLSDALESAGVDPAAYDPKRPPADLGEADRAAIEVAATRLGAPDALQALAAVDQQVRDVCQTRLSL